MTGRDHPRPVGAAAIGDRRPGRGPAADSADSRTDCCPVPARPGPCRDRTSGRRRSGARRDGHSSSVRRCPVRSPFRVLSSVRPEDAHSIGARGCPRADVPCSRCSRRALGHSLGTALRPPAGSGLVRRSQHVLGRRVRVFVREHRGPFREILLGDARRQRLMSARPRDYVRPRGDRSDEDRLLMGPRCPAPHHPQPTRPLAPGSRGQLARPLKGRGRRLLRAR